jgi:hypothetical protein
MKKQCLVLLILLAALPLAAQNNNANNRNAGTLGNGYGEITWGSTLADVKGKVRGEITFTDNKTIIVSREGEITYRYGFFFQDPAKAPAAPQPAAAPGRQPAAQPAGGQAAAPPAPADPKFFYSVVEFPYVSMDDITKKITETYGDPTARSIKDNQGALIWDSEKTTLVMWVDRYEGKPFCRKLNYYSKDIVTDLNEYYRQMFNRKELEVLQQMRP